MEITQNELDFLVQDLVSKDVDLMELLGTFSYAAFEENEEAISEALKKAESDDFEAIDKIVQDEQEAFFDVYHTDILLAKQKALRQAEHRLKTFFTKEEEADFSDYFYDAIEIEIMDYFKGMEKQIKMEAQK